MAMYITSLKKNSCCFSPAPSHHLGLKAIIVLRRVSSHYFYSSAFSVGCCLPQEHDFRHAQPVDSCRVHDLIPQLIGDTRTFVCLVLCVCVCVCVFFPFILDIKFVGRTSRGHTGGRSHRISHPPSFCGACLNFSREKDSAIPFPRRP